MSGRQFSDSDFVRRNCKCFKQFILDEIEERKCGAPNLRLTVLLGVPFLRSDLLKCHVQGIFVSRAYEGFLCDLGGAIAVVGADGLFVRASSA